MLVKFLISAAVGYVLANVLFPTRGWAAPASGNVKWHCPGHWMEADGILYCDDRHQVGIGPLGINDPNVKTIYPGKLTPRGGGRYVPKKPDETFISPSSLDVTHRISTTKRARLTVA